MQNDRPRTLFEKIWDGHTVKAETAEMPAVLYIDLHLVHEVTSPQAFSLLRERGLRVRRPGRTVATMDHSVPTVRFAVADAQGRAQMAQLGTNCAEQGIELHGMGSEGQGLVHVIRPEPGLT